MLIDKSQVIVEKAGCSQSAVSTHVDGKLIEKGKRGSESAQASRKVRPRASESFTRSGLRLQMFSGKELQLPHHPARDLRNILLGLKRERTALLLSSSKSSFHMKSNCAFQGPEIGE